MEKKKGIWKKASKVQKVILSVCLLGIFGSLVSAGYFFVYQKSMTGYVVGGDTTKIDITSDELGDFVVNVSGAVSPVTESKDLILTNADAKKVLSKNLTITKVNNDEECPNYEDDCSVDLYYSNGSITSENVIIESGENTYQLIAECLPRSCPQNISVDIGLTE